MPEARAELRALQRKAYGPDGGLTGAEAARLRELDALRLASLAQEPERSDETKDALRLAPLAQEPEEVQGSENPRFLSEERSDETKDAPAAQGPALHTLRSHWKLLAAASAGLLVVGLGAGWALFAPHTGDAVALTSDEAQRKLELDETYKFDEGSLRAIARDKDALVWFGTKDDAAQSCLVLDVGEQSTTSCQLTSELEQFGLGTSISVPAKDSTDQNDYGGSINAYAQISTTGEPMVAVQRWNYDSSQVDQYPVEERDRAEELTTTEGYQMGISLVGYLEDQPIWVGDKLGEQGANTRCLIVDALEAVACDDGDKAIETGLTVGAERGSGSSIEVKATFTTFSSPYLTITERD